MKLKLTLSLILFLQLLLIKVSAQQTSTIDNVEPCITTDQYELIEKRCNDNAALFIPTTLYRPSAIVLLQWPLQAAVGFTDCSYYFIAAHVDHDNTSAFKDYNCGNITYNGHRGTDIAISPFPFFKMDNNQIEVIAAATGTIIDKHDGEYDRNCVGAGSNLVANYIILQHADGSRTLYWHMKSGKFTAKAIGQSVAAGEYLGIVGSSGSSSGPHLHFEVWSGSTNTTYIDPFSGTCNTVSLTSKWLTQKPYTEPAVIKASVHTTDYIAPTCGITETLNESKIFVTPFQGTGLSAGFAKFYVFLRNQTNGTSATMSILNPDASTYLTWTQNFTSTNNYSYVQYSKKLPTTSGVYTFQATYGGTTCSQSFEIRSCADNYNAWSGTTNTDWATANNWSCGTVPTNTTNVVIYSGVPNYPIINSSADCRSLTVFPSATVQVNTGFGLKVAH
ncbi:M23 family metallopeptidase [Ferruginibacter lapsinanis]|uniref:M23 family metallopeptidase n=1 Tax=Ferruginibacter lapsinanis TaxID=563172 RepID=UPI001E520A31|nr:M23 family metallopeptidase [Ferruginibacter lapsinanis]UEG50895.1 M23 family metallopeptidase [Ferruginibacter lapsinanis]